VLISTSPIPNVEVKFSVRKTSTSSHIWGGRRWRNSG